MSSCNRALPCLIWSRVCGLLEPALFWCVYFLVGKCVCSDSGRPGGRGVDDTGQRRRDTRALPGARLVDHLLAHQVSRETIPLLVFLL